MALRTQTPSRPIHSSSTYPGLMSSVGNSIPLSNQSWPPMYVKIHDCRDSCFHFLRTMSVSLTQTSPVRPQWTLLAVPRSPRALTSCSRASRTWLPRSSRSCRKTSLGQGASAVHGLDPSPGDFKLKSCLEQMSLLSIKGRLHGPWQRHHGGRRPLRRGGGGGRVHHHLPRHRVHGGRRR